MRTAEHIFKEWHEQWAAAEDPLARIHREWREECRAKGHDVEGNLRVVLERIKDKLADPTIPLFVPPREREVRQKKRRRT